jgi:hypothetical protein
MFFNLFGKKNSFQKKVVNIIYLSEKAKQHAILRYARKRNNTIFLAWFNNTATDYKIVFTANELDENRIITIKEFSAIKYAHHELVCVEHYPLSAKEEELLTNSQQQNFIFYNALTEPLFQYFGSHKIIDVAQKLGFKENEVIQHSLITKSIVKAQEKIAKKVSFEKTANSQKDWMLANVSNGNV